MLPSYTDLWNKSVHTNYKTLKSNILTELLNIRLFFKSMDRENNSWARGYVLRN